MNAVRRDPRLRYVRLLALALPITAGAYACSARSDDADASASHITGGSPSNDAAVVLVADASDHYLCSGALVAPDVVVLSARCSAAAAAVYVGFSVKVGATEALAPRAGGASRSAVGGVDVRGDFAFLRLTSAAPAVPLERISSLPATGDICTVAGHGRDEGSGDVGEQRSASMRVTVASLGEIVAQGVTGSVAPGSFDGLLICGGKLAGVKRANDYGSAVASAVRFVALAETNAQTFDDAIANLSADGGAPGLPPPTPGTPCGSINEIASARCGNCGTRETACLASEGGAIWTEYAMCHGERDCGPGTTDVTTAGCTAGAQRERLCGNACAWTSWSACR